MTFLVVAVVVLAGLLVVERRRRPRVWCGGCGRRIHPGWQALVLDGETFCDEDCWRALPALQRKAQAAARMLRPWWSRRQW